MVRFYSAFELHRAYDSRGYVVKWGGSCRVVSTKTYVNPRCDALWDAFQDGFKFLEHNLLRIPPQSCMAFIGFPACAYVVIANCWNVVSSVFTSV